MATDPRESAASVGGAVRTEKPWAEHVRPTPEQFAAWLKACTDEERVDVAGKMLDAQDRAARCFEMDHYRNGERVGELLALVDELTAQRDLARDAAVALEQELAQRGRCGDLAPTLAGGTALPVCDLPAGHDGWHRADDGCEWSHGSAVLGLGLQPETSEQ